ncbi:MATE family efflux transporter [Eubacteriales bacterium OttesenSCG-928-N14]|nr:MATE family efflux transporter [Eubacteriales bacterium OttesenSCG-928-N14]
MEQTPKKQNKMGHAPMFKLIMSMALPAMFSMIVQACYNIVDSLFVARLGEEAMTALSLAFPAQMLMVGVGVGTGVGINSLISRRLGEKRFAEADDAASHGIFLALCSAMVFALLGIFAAGPFMRAFTENTTVSSMGTTYLSIVMAFSFGSFIQIATEKVLQGTGNMIFPMVIQLVGAVTNIILDPIMIFGLFGFPALGVAGAAIATVLGQILGMVIGLIIVFTKEHEVTPKLRGFRPKMPIVVDIYRVGLPSIVMQTVGSFLNMGLNTILIGFSDAAVSVLGSYYKLNSFIFMPVFGLNQGLMPVMGYNYGAKNRQRLMHALRIGCMVAICIMAVGTLLFWVFPEQLLGIFSPTPERIAIGVPAFRIISISFVGAAVSIIFSTLFQAIGNGKLSLLVSLLRQVVILLPSAYFLSKLGVSYVWYAWPLSEGMALFGTLVVFLHLKRTMLAALDEGGEDLPAVEAAEMSTSPTPAL